MSLEQSPSDLSPSLALSLSLSPRGSLAEQYPKILYDPMPVIWFKPGQFGPPKLTVTDTHLLTHSPPLFSQLRRLMSRRKVPTSLHSTRRQPVEVSCPPLDTPLTMCYRSHWQLTSLSSNGSWGVWPCCVSWMTNKVMWLSCDKLRCTVWEEYC